MPYTGHKGTTQDDAYFVETALWIWRSKPYKFPRFAEYHLKNSSLSDDGVQDTGSIYRAFPPIVDAESRTRLRRYEGPAPVVNSRVVCVRPDIEVKDLLIVGYADLEEDGQNSYQEISLGGVVGLPAYRQYPMLRVFGEKSPSFRCRSPLADPDYPGSWQLSMCAVELKLKSVSEGPEWSHPKDATNRSFVDPSHGPFTRSVVLFLNTTGTVSDW